MDAVCRSGAFCLNPLGECLRRLRQIPFQILLNDERGDGGSQVGAESAVLNENGNGYLRVVHGSKADECRVVFAWIFHRSRFPAYRICRRIDT